MRLIRNAVKTAVIAKLIQEARKPGNQEKLRRLWQQVTAKVQATPSR